LLLRSRPGRSPRKSNATQAGRSGDAGHLDSYGGGSTDYGINGHYNNDAEGRHFAWTFSSLHPGGAQFVFADGSVHFLSETLDYLTFARLARIQDGQPVGQFD
jgi:prepilin-type processing-associated H-X9-DG protein